MTITFPCTKAVGPGGETFECNDAGKKFKLIIPSGMFSSTAYLRFYTPYDEGIIPPPGYQSRQSKIFEIQKIYGANPNQGYKFRFECYFDTPNDIDCAQSVDADDPGSWMPACTRATRWYDTSSMMGGRWDTFGFFANWKQD